jgi:hypothetical protein
MKTLIAILFASLVAIAPLQADPNVKVPRSIATVQTPDRDAHRVAVTLTADKIQLPSSIDGGKNAFVVKNASNEKLRVAVHDPDRSRAYDFTFPAQATKIFQVQLKPGVYQTSCVIHGRQTKEVSISLTVR